MWMTTAMMGSMTFRSLGINARRILDFLLFEHASHGGKENGNLGATYLQLEAWGVTSTDIRKGFAELYATGFVELTKQGARVAGGDQSRYALTWLPTLPGTPDAMPPSHAWSRMADRLYREGRNDLPAIKAWLKEQTADHRRKPRPTKQDATPQLHPLSPRNCRVIAGGKA
jgi:hypothetical protein